MNQLRQEWMAQHPDIDPLEKDIQGADAPYVAPGDMPLQMELAYKVEITCASIHKNNFGDKQILLKLRVLTDQDELQVGTHTEHLTLPFQASDMQVSDQEMVRKRHKRRIQDVTRILSACEPERFSLYDKKEGSTYYDFDGQPMDKDSFKARNTRIDKATLDMIDYIHSLQMGEYVEALAGTKFYLRRVPNTKKPRYPYTNFYAKRPKAAVGNPPIEIFDGVASVEELPF
jgi:hypothetical protein